jgi:hypothetical protein
MKKKGKAILLIAVLLVGLTIGTGIAMDLPNKVTKEVAIESEDGRSRMSWVAMTSLWSSSSSHRSDSSDPIDKIGVEAYLYSGEELIDSGVLMNYNDRFAWKWLYGNGDFAETYHTFEYWDGSEWHTWYPHTGDSG